MRFGDLVEKIIPDELVSIFEEAKNWTPREYTSGDDPKIVIQKIINNTKPLGYFDTGLISLAELNNLSWVGTPNNWILIYKQENQGFAKLFNWAENRSLNSAIRHYIQGICLGYPIDNIEKFVMDGFKTSDYKLAVIASRIML